MKNVLFIVYYFPPMGGSGVQRPLKFAKYLRKFGWNPIVLCPEPGVYHTFDNSLKEELDRLEIEVHRVAGNTPFHRLGQQKREFNVPGVFAKILRWLSDFFYLPDNKKNWIEPAFQEAMNLINQKNIKVIFTSAPPYSNLMLAKNIKQETGLPVVMDLRDDWAGSHLIQYPTSWHKKRMEEIEFDTLDKADILLTINEEIAESLQSRTSKKVRIIGHGYDPEDFDGMPDESEDSGTKIKFLYSGTFYDDSRPDYFLKAIHQLLKKQPEIRDKVELQFQGGLNQQHWRLINQLKLNDLVTDFGYLDHDMAVRNLQKADVLWLNIGQKKNPQIISLSKTSEYFATRKPILGLVPDGAAKKMLERYQNSFIAEPHNISEIKQQISILIERFEKKEWTLPAEEFIEEFNRKNLTHRLADIFDEIIR